MINAPQTVQDALTSGNFTYANFITINLGDVYNTASDLKLYYTDYHSAINIDGNTYTPDHNVVEIDGISRKASTGSDKLEISFSVTDPVIIQAIKTGRYVNKASSITRGIIQDGSVLEGFLIPVRTAWGLSHSFSGGRDDRVVTLVIDSVLGALSADNGWYALDSSHQQRYPNDRIMRHSPTVFTEQQKDKYTANFNGTINAEVKPPALPKIYGYKNAEPVPILMLKHRKSHSTYRHYFTTFIYAINIGECDFVDVQNIKLDGEGSDIRVVNDTGFEYGGWSCRVRTPAENLISCQTDPKLNFWRQRLDANETARLLDMYGKGLTLLFVINRNRDDWLTSPPEITVPVRGAKVYDPRLGVYYPPDFVGAINVPTSVFSRNPALQYADYLRSTEYGAGRRNIPITNANIIELANHFDQIPDSIGNAGINSILIDVQIDTGNAIVDNMNVWMEGTRLYTSDYYGEFNVRVETKSLPVWTFNEGDLEGDTQYESGDFTDKINNLTYTIKQLVPDVSEDAVAGDLVEVDVEATFPDYGTQIHTDWLAEDGGIDNFSSEALDYVSEVEQALYWTMVDARIARQPRTLEIPVGAVGWLFEAGDVIQHTSEIMEETNSYWRIDEVSEDGGTTVLNCVAYDDTFYVPDPNVVPAPAAFAQPPVTLAIPAVTGFSLLIDNGEFYLQWDDLDDTRVLWYAVEIYIGTTLVQSGQRLSQSPLLITNPLVESYTANIVPFGINLEGDTTNLTFDIYVPITSTDTPTVTSKAGFISVEPPEPESNKFTYEWRWSTSADATVISGGTTNALTISDVIPDITYNIDYRIVTPNGKGLWESVAVNGVEKLTYIWYVYADDNIGTGISLDPSGKGFFGIVGGKSTPTPVITDPTIYDYYAQPLGGTTVGDGITAQLTKENYVVHTDINGVGGDFSGAFAKLDILVGSLNDTNSWTVTTTESAGVTGSLVGTTYTITALSTNQGLVTFTATRTDYPTFVRSFNIAKVTDGLDGSFKSFIFKIVLDGSGAPAVPTGGTFNGTSETYPTGWTDTSQYSGVGIEYVSTNVYVQNSGGNWVLASSWAAPAVYARTGSDGSRGAGTYSVPVGVSTWSDTTANAATPGSNQISDTVIQYNVATEYTETKAWDGGAWQTADVIIDGNLVVNTQAIINSLAANAIDAAKINVGTIAIEEANWGTNVSISASGVVIEAGFTGTAFQSVIVDGSSAASVGSYYDVTYGAGIKIDLDRESFGAGGNANAWGIKIDQNAAGTSGIGLDIYSGAGNTSKGINVTSQSGVGGGIYSFRANDVALYAQSQNNIGMYVQSASNGAYPALRVSGNLEVIGVGGQGDSKLTVMGEEVATLGSNTFTGTQTASNFTLSSDKKLKTNIEIIPDALEKLSKVRGVTFDRIDMDNESQVGVIAQELQAILPESVVEVEGILRVNPMAVIGLLVAAVNELAAENKNRG